MLSGRKAQNTIQSIRQRYADTKESIAATQGNEGMPPQYHQVKVIENLPATGFHQEHRQEPTRGHDTCNEVYSGPDIPAQHRTYYHFMLEHYARLLTLFEAIEGAMYY